jgi:hypothetical protein
METTDEKTKPFRLVLTPEQSAAIRASGLGFAAGAPVNFRITTGPCTILLFECDKATADAAVGVVIGTHAARKKPSQSITTPKP